MRCAGRLRGLQKRSFRLEATAVFLRQIFFADGFSLCGRHIATSVRPSRPATRGVPSPLSLKAAAMGDHKFGFAMKP